MASPSAGAPALKHGDVNTVTPSSGEVKGLIYPLNILQNAIKIWQNYLIRKIFEFLIPKTKEASKSEWIICGLNKNFLLNIQKFFHKK